MPNESYLYPMQIENVCYQYDEDELNRILSVALQTRECQQIIAKIKSESRESTSTQSTIFNAENESEGDTE